ncbi:hypothetical protein R5O24_02875 [Tenacibaculum maritimum]|uniref:hypothetical protein n=1 Tax=Tenacibaculum maritimum TaxID=107401 RepID=UPI00388D0546
MKSLILDQLKKKYEKSGGHCGLYIKDFNGNLKDIKQALNELYKSKKITVHDGIHGKLIKYRNEQK